MDVFQTNENTISGRLVPIGCGVTISANSLVAQRPLKIVVQQDYSINIPYYNTMPTKYIELRLQNAIVHAAKEPDTLLAQLAIFHSVHYAILGLKASGLWAHHTEEVCVIDVKKKLKKKLKKKNIKYCIRDYSEHSSVGPLHIMMSSYSLLVRR